MKLLGRDIPARELVSKIEARLRARGLGGEALEEWQEEGVEPRVDPLSFNLQALEENEDCTRPLPRRTHRDGLSGALVIGAKQTFRQAAQVFINEALGRQRVFNMHTRDAYAQLAAEVLKLRAEVDALRAKNAAVVEEKKAPAPKPPPRAARKPKAPRKR